MSFITKTFLVLSFFITLSYTPSVKAASLVAGALEPTQILNNVELLGVNLAGAATEINTYLLQVKQTILDPIGDAMIVMSQLQSADSIIKMITGGTQGNSLIISDPQKYFESRGLEVVKRSLGDLSQQKGIYSDSIYGSVLSNFKQTSLTSELQAINQSQVPNLLQQNICSDASLSSLAEQDILAGGGTSNDTQAINARKQSLYSSLCSGNPSTDSALAKTLLSVQKQRPEVGGWATWLAITGGDNAYNKSLEANRLIAQAQAEKEAIARDDYNNGKGVVSQTKCTLYAMVDAQGEPIKNPTEADCVERQIINPAGLLSDSLTKAVNAGLDKLTTIQGDSGWGSAASLIGSVKGILQGINSVKTTLNGVQNSVSGIQNSANIMTGGGTNYANSPQTMGIATTPVKNLTNDPQGKASLVTPIKKLIVNNLDFMEQLDAASRDQVALIQPYEARIKYMKACYDDVAPGNAQATAAYNLRMDAIKSAYTTIDKNFQAVSTVKKISQETLDALDKSFSSEEISTIFASYQSKIQTSNMPDYRAVALYKGQYVKDKSKVDADMGTNGELTGLINQCEQERINRGYQGGV